MRHLSVLVLLILAGCAGRRPEPVILPVGYELAASVSRGAGVSEPVTLLTDHDRARDIHPVFAAGWLYFASNRDGDGFNIYRKRMNARAVERLTCIDGDEYWPRVTLDGRWLAFGGNARGHWDLYLIDLQAVGAPQLLTPQSRYDCIQPAWSPDGWNLVYSGYSSTLDAWSIRGMTFGEDASANAAIESISHRKEINLSLGVRWQPGQRSLGEVGASGGTKSPGETVACRLKPVACADYTGKETSSLRPIQSHWNLLSAGNTPVTGLHTDYSPDGRRLTYQEHRRDGDAWYCVKVYDFASGLTNTLSPPRGYGAIQPRMTPDGGGVVFLTAAKAGARPEAGDGFALADFSGNVIRDIRNPCGRGEVSDPVVAVVNGKTLLIFSWTCGAAECLCSVTLP